MGNKIIKSVSFNQTVTDDKAMLKHFSRKNFSGYVKKLIMADMSKGKESIEEVETHVIEVKKEETNEEKRARLLQQKNGTNKPAPLLSITKPKH